MDDRLFGNDIASQKHAGHLRAKRLDDFLEIRSVRRGRTFVESRMASDIYAGYIGTNKPVMVTESSQ
jgi:hypothetical protein